MAGKNAFRSAVIGAGAMYYFDPNAGRRRRASLRDQVFHLWNITKNSFSRASRDFNHRLVGLLRETRANMLEEGVPDAKLTERVRSRMGRIVSNPTNIQVAANDGDVILSGAVDSRELMPLLSCVANTRGIKSIENSMTIHSFDNSNLFHLPKQKRRLPGNARLLGNVTALTLAGLTVYGVLKRDFLTSLLAGGAFTAFARKHKTGNAMTFEKLRAVGG